MRPGAIALTVVLAGCRLGFDETVVSDAAFDGPFAVGGTLTSLAADGVVLQNNGADDLALTAPGPFTFATPLVDGEAYDVTVAVAPAGQTCVVANGRGVVTHARIADIEVACFVEGTCPPAPMTFTTDTIFTLPTGCATFTVEAHGGGGAGGAKNAGAAAAAGGAGGRAIATYAAAAGTQYAITIGRGGTCESTAQTPGGYTGGGGGVDSGFGDGDDGAGTGAGGVGGAGSTGTQPGGAGGDGRYGGGGGGGGGDKILGNSGGGATTFASVSPSVELVIAGGGGGAGASDQNGDVAGAGGDACNGYSGAGGTAAVSGSRSGGGGGGGACTCAGGTCDSAPTPTGGAGGSAGTGSSCTAAQNGAHGHVTITFP